MRSLWLPMIVPFWLILISIMVWGVGLLLSNIISLPEVGHSARQFLLFYLYLPIMVIGASPVYAGIPYIFLLFVLKAVCKKKPLRFLKIWIITLPLQLALLCLLWGSFFSIAKNFWAFSMALGYLYIVPVFLIGYAKKRAGKFREETYDQTPKSV